MIGYDIKAPAPAEVGTPAAGLAADRDPVEDNIRGQAEGDRTLGLAHQGIAHPNAVHVAALEVWRRHGSEGLLGFHRRLQKTLERAHRA